MAPKKDHGDEEAESHGGYADVKVQNAELFSDLVFVVGLNIIAASLEHRHNLAEGFGIFLLRVFAVWYLWNKGAIMMNLAQRFDDDGKFNFFDYVIGFFLLATTALMARTIKLDDDAGFITWYLVARFVQCVFMFIRVWMRKEKPRMLAQPTTSLAASSLP